MILRPVFVLITLMMLVLAFFQVSGRLMFSVLDELEVGVNRWLSPQQIVLTGLAGEWHGINPVVNIERVTLPAGHLADLHLELDWLESLVRNRLVVRQASLAGGRLLLERTEQGWRLAGGGGSTEFDPFDTLYHSDQIEVALDIGFIGEDGSAKAIDEVLIGYQATNRGGQHRHRVTLRNRDCSTDCVLELALDSAEAVPFLREQQIDARLTGTGLKIPAPLLAGGGAGGGRLVSVEGSWWRDGPASGGQGRASFSDLTIDDDRLGGGFEIAASGTGDRHHLELRELYLENDESGWRLPKFWLTLDAADGGGTLRAWTDRIETGAGFRFLAALAPRQTAVFRWLNALQVQATALNVHAFVTFPELATGYLATVRDVALDGYNGAPWIRGGAGELLGANRSIQLLLNAEQLGVQFPDMFHQRWDMDYLNGRLQAFVSRDYFGLRGTNLRAELDGTHASGGFSLSRPDQSRFRERLSLLVNLDHTTVAEGRQYIPYQLPAGLPEWLESGPRSGNLREVALAYHGQVHTRPGELARRVEFAGRISEGHVQYHPDWPVVRDLSGFISVAGRDVSIIVDEGLSLESTDLAGSRIRLRDNANFADIDLSSDSNVAEALTFIRSTPLADWMQFVTPDWSGRGPIRMTGRLLVPLKLGEPTEAVDSSLTAADLEVDMDIELLSADLDLPGYGVALGELLGKVHYQYPYAVSGSGVRGRIFGRPAIFGASADSDSVIFHVEGQAPYEEVLTLLDVSDPGGIRGGFDFMADLHIELGDDVSRIDLVSDLTGLELELPGEFAKQADEAEPSELELRFLDGYQSVRFRYGAAQGWLHVDQVPLRGAIGFSAQPPMVDSTENLLVLGGRIEGFSVDQVVPDAESGPALAIPVSLADLQVGLLDVNGIGFADAVLSGQIGTGGNASDLLLDVQSPDLKGTLKFTEGKPLVLNLDLLRLPVSEAEPGTDPLDVSVIAQLVAADVTLGRLLVGETEYGSWSFDLRPDSEGLALVNLNANLRGLAITSERLYWNAQSNRSQFNGILKAVDLAEVLPQWGYAPSVTTERAELQADLSWRGSPAAVDLERLKGRASFEADNGRFVDVTGGTDAMKIFSLVNFSTIAKRLNFDFSDVMGDGVSFDSLTATTEFQEGTMQFLEPMAVDGSGSNFRIAGSVDLIGGQLDNEMIVTLPVTRGLPWYAAYVALANPLAGLGVLVGERVLRKPLSQFSSAKYQITGTLDDPELKFVSVWDTSMDEPQVSLEQIEGEPVESEPDAAPDPHGANAAPTEEVTQNTGTTTG